MANCRFCGKKLENNFVDLGMSPLANKYLKHDEEQRGEIFYPLHTYVCSSCYLVQLEEFESPKEIFSDYAYFSSFSGSWLKHAQDYVEKMVDRFDFKESAKVIEIASNDGYLLQYFKKRNIDVLGIEPAKNIADEAIKKGIATKNAFFGEDLAEELIRENVYADLLIGNNVLAHVPNINDFVIGMKKLLRPNGIITMEFPHILKLIEENQFDTIYHEHFSYLSLIATKKIFNDYNLDIFDVEELSTHGGSLRIYVKHIEDSSKFISGEVELLINKEKKMGLDKIETYTKFADRIKKKKRDILNFLIGIKNQGKQIVGYGAPAKGNTLLNYCGVGKDFIEYTVDINPYKQGLFLPGTHIPIYSVDKINETKPDYIIILPWNIKDEIIEQMKFVKEWEAKFVTLIPNINIY